VRRGRSPMPRVSWPRTPRPALRAAEPQPRRVGTVADIQRTLRWNASRPGVTRRAVCDSSSRATPGCPRPGDALTSPAGVYCLAVKTAGLERIIACFLSAGVARGTHRAFPRVTESITGGGNQTDESSGNGGNRPTRLDSRGFLPSDSVH
jgi:hypothetical protein